MALLRKYFGLDAATLLTMRTETLAAISAAKKRGTSFSQPDISMSFPSLTELSDELAEITAALAYIQNTGTRITVGGLR